MGKRLSFAKGGEEKISNFHTLIRFALFGEKNILIVWKVSTTKTAKAVKSSLVELPEQVFGQVWHFSLSRRNPAQQRSTNVNKFIKQNP